MTDEPRIDEPRIEEEPHVEETPVDELAAVTQERDEYLDALQRLKAEFDNYRKRVARDQQELAARAHERLVKELVPILDDLERALEAAAQHEEAQLEEGVRLVHRSLGDLLAREGLVESRPPASSIRTPRRRSSRSRRTRRKAPSSRCSRRATSSATACCGLRVS